MLVYVDTAALVALAHKRDSLHEKAVSVYRRLLNEKSRFLTTNAVLLEVGNSFSKTVHKPLAASIFHLVRTSASWWILPVDEKWLSKGLERFIARADKDWSLTDCIGMIAAETYNANSVFTSDRHFEQAGFTLLL